MPDQETISHQFGLLTIYRSNLRTLEQQIALNAGNADVSTSNQIRLCQANITRTKRVLRDWQQHVEDLPGENVPGGEPIPDDAQAPLVVPVVVIAMTSEQFGSLTAENAFDD